MKRSPQVSSKLLKLQALLQEDTELCKPCFHLSCCPQTCFSHDREEDRQNEQNFPCGQSVAFSVLRVGMYVCICMCVCVCAGFECEPEVSESKVSQSFGVKVP